MSTNRLESAPVGSSFTILTTRHQGSTECRMLEQSYISASSGQRDARVCRFDCVYDVMSIGVRGGIVMSQITIWEIRTFDLEKTPTQSELSYGFSTTGRFRYALKSIYGNIILLVTLASRLLTREFCSRMDRIGSFTGHFPHHSNRRYRERFVPNIISNIYMSEGIFSKPIGEVEFVMERSRVQKVNKGEMLYERVWLAVARFFAFTAGLSPNLISFKSFSDHCET